MVVQKEKTTTLQVQVNTGTTQSPRYKNLAFNHIDPNADIDQVKVLGEKAAACQTHPLEAIMLVEKGTLTEEV